MKTRRIEGTDIQAALREVRRALGPDAVIMSTRETPEGIEIVAAPAPLREASRRPALREPRRESKPRRTRAARKRVVHGGFAHLVAGIARPAVPEPAFPDVGAELDALGLAADVRDALCDAVAGSEPAQAIAAAHRALAARLRTEGAVLMHEGGRVAMLGATGVGKTTTIAKLAAHFARRHGPDTVALINADKYRIGASDQLRRFGRLIGVPTYDVDGSRELERRLAKLADRRLVLVDTAGLAPGDVRFTEQNALLAGAGLECCLALSLNTQTAVLARYLRAYSRQLTLRALVLTKEDEALSLGGGLSMAVRHQVPVSFVTTGPNVPADIRLAKSDKLVARARGLAAHGRAAEARDGAPGEQPGSAMEAAR